MELNNAKDRTGHFLFWGSGVFLALLPYLLLYIKPEWRAPWILEPGQFADNLVVAIRHILIGATLGAWLWFLIKRVNPLSIMKAWWKKPSQLNWIWFFLTLSIYSLHNILVLVNLPFSTGEVIAVGLGRMLTAFIVISLIWLGARIASLASPTRLRNVPWIVPALIPGFLGVDALAIIIWKNSLRYMINKIDEDGPIDIARTLKGGGIEIAPVFVVLGLIAFALILCALCLGSSHLSRKISSKKMSMKPAFILFILSCTWVGIATEKASGFAWKSRKALRMEQNSYDIHLTPIKPEPGVVSYSANWRPAYRPNLTTPLKSTPDIYMIIMESTRADAISEKHAPFLTHFRDYESQQFGKTWASSNATHLSWFSIFNGQLPPFWGNAIEVIRDGGELAPSPLIELLKKNEYRVQARTVCDLTYLGMGSTNFGSPHGLDVLKSSPNGSEFEKLTVSERERQNLEETKKILASSPSSGNFHLLAYDSPHFDYTWHESFQPPYENYEPSGGFHAYPKPEDIERVRNRYYNAVAWTDHEIERFVHFLKEQNRYDDSIIIITGDHGEEFHEHGSWFHCSSVEPEQTSVPLMIKWPRGTRTPPQKSASHLDILPSLMDYFGQPKSEIAKLPGRSLLKKRRKEITQVNITSYCGITGISMAWHRGDYTATFRWENPWATQLPETISLDDIVGPNGSLNLETPEDWNAALRKHFPDAPKRLFSEFDQK